MAHGPDTVELLRRINSGNPVVDLTGLNITSLPSLLNKVNVTTLICCKTQLTALPDLPPNLTKLSCRANKLTTLPVLPPTLVSLYCDNNQLTTLPVLPPGIVSLYCRNNQLTTLPVLPDTLEYLEF
jgi:Leucine-rich repeat (LRR) protein